MAAMSKRMTRLLAGLAVVFVIVLIILCLVPSYAPPHTLQAGKSSGTVPEDIVTGTPDTTTHTATETTTSSTSTTPEPSTTEAITKLPESSTAASTLPVDEEDETTTESYDRVANDTDIEEPVEEGSGTTETTTDLWFSSPTTSTSETLSSTTEATIIEISTNATEESEPTPTEDGLWSAYNETEETVETTLATSSVTSTTHHYDEVHNETSTEIYNLFTETTVDDISESPEPTTSTDVENETLITATDVQEETTITTTDAKVETLRTTTDVEETSTTTAEVVETTEATTEVAKTSETSTTTEAETTVAVTTTPDQHESVLLEIKDEPDVCTHPDCKELAARMLDMMDHRADPCQDFYQYACGGVEDDPFLHPEDPSEQVFSRMLEMLKAPDSEDEPSFSPAREFYKSCTDHPLSPTPQMVDKLREQVNKYGLLDPRVLGGDPELTKQYAFIDEDTFRLQQMIADFIKLDYALFFDVGVDVDKRDNKNFAVRLSLPLDGFNSGLSESIDTTFCSEQHQRNLQRAVKSNLPLDLNSEYEELQQCRIKGLGQAHLVNRLQEAARALNLTQHVTDATLAQRLIGETALDSEFLLEEIKETWPEPAEIRHLIINKNFTEYTPEQLDNEDILTNLVNWRELLEGVVGRRVSKVQVYHEGDLRSVMKNIEQIAKDRSAGLRNMLLMLWGARLYTDIVAPEGRGAPGSAPYCVAVTQHLLPDLAAEMFLKSFSVIELEAMGQQVHRVVNSVKKTVSASLQHKSGVSEELKDKLQRTFTQVGATEYLQQLSEEVAKSTENLFLEEDYVENVLTLLRRRRAMLYSVMGESTTGHLALWNHFSVPHSITATTLYGANSILIPEGIMTAPYLYPHLQHLPDYITFAGIGHVIAHEFLHAIDTTGIKFDGMIGEELTRPPVMDEREYCFSTLLSSNFSLQVRNATVVSFRLPKELHLNEQMVDSEATRLAWLSYVHGDTADGGAPLEVVTDRPMRRRRSVTTASSERLLPWLGLSPYQLFLLRTAQTQCARTSHQDVFSIMEREHLPARLRVNLALVNEPLFAEAFQCPLESKMAAPYTCPYLLGTVHGPQH